MNLAFFGLFVLAGTIATGSLRYRRTVSYDGEQVLSCSLRTGLDALNDALGLDIWGVRDGHVSIRVNMMQKKKVFEFFEGNCSIEIDDLETTVSLREHSMNKRTDAEWFEEYHTYEEITVWYEKLAATSDLVTFVPSIGESYEGRDQPAVEITAPGGGDDKPKIYWQCQIHAREWITGATCMYIVNYFVENYGTDDVVTLILDDMELHVVPFTNPDGYVYTWTDDRMWRKSRQPNQGSECIGTDVNRNWNDHWGEIGSSDNPCSGTYRGSAAESCPEVRNNVAYFKKSAPVFGAVDWHSYGQLVLRPYSWTTDDSPDEETLKEIGDGVRAVVLTVHNTQFTSGKWYNALYPSSGVASDWFYGENATKNNEGYRAAGFTWEMRDTGEYGFQLPASQIIPVGEEMAQGAKFFCLNVLQRPLKP